MCLSSGYEAFRGLGSFLFAQAFASDHMVDEAAAAKFAQVARDCANTSTEALENVQKFIGALKNARQEKEASAWRILCWLVFGFVF